MISNDLSIFWNISEQLIYKNIILIWWKSLVADNEHDFLCTIERCDIT